jgi:hypothetical protein
MKRDIPLIVLGVAALSFAFIFRSPAALFAGVLLVAIFYVRELIPDRTNPTEKRLQEMRTALNVLSVKVGLARPFPDQG